MIGSLTSSFKSFLRCAFFFVAIVSLISESLIAVRADDRLTFKADHYSSNLDTHTTKVSGNVDIVSGTQHLTSNSAILDSAHDTVTAEGNVVFDQQKIHVTGDRMELNIKTGLGTFYNAILVMQGRLHAEGRVMTRYADDRYRILDGKLTYCLDCPQSWSVTGAWMDMQVEGYAEIHHALFQVRDSPVAYFPIFYFPVKTKRQSGFLIPQTGYNSDLGFEFMTPFFWAISNDSDSTFEYRYMDKGGNRLWTENRFLFSDRSYIKGESSIDKNGTVPGVPNTRYGYSYAERWQLSPQWTQRYRGEMASDAPYTNDFANEFNQTLMPSLVNEPSLSWQNSNYFAYGLMRFNQINIPRDPGTYPPTLGDVDRLPELGFSAPSQQLWGRIRGSTDFQTDSFGRFRGGPIDPNTGWLLTGQRTTLTGRLTAPMPLFNVLTWKPMIETRADIYNFQATGIPSTAARGRVYFDQVLSTDISRVYQTDSGNLKAVKNSITPSLRWSYSPYDALTKHPFFQNVTAPNGQAVPATGQPPRFDIFDPNSSDAGAVELSTLEEELRLKHHHLLTFGIGTRVVGRFGDTNKSYQEFLSVKVERDYDLLAEQFGNIHLLATGNYAGFHLSTEFNFDPVSGNADVRSDASYGHSRYSVGVYQDIETATRTYGLNAAVKNVGPFTVSTAVVYDDYVQPHQISQLAASIGYASLAKCWSLTLNVTKIPGGSGFTFAPLLSLSISEAAHQASL